MPSLSNKGGVKLEYSLTLNLNKLFDKDIIIDDKVRLETHNVFAKIVNPWVPYLNSPLSTTLDITPDYVRYEKGYAYYQYSGVVNEANRTRTVHPLATSRWDKVAMQTELPKFENDVKAILNRRYKELYDR